MPQDPLDNLLQQNGVTSDPLDDLIKKNNVASTSTIESKPFYQPVVDLWNKANESIISPKTAKFALNMLVPGTIQQAPDSLANTIGTDFIQNLFTPFNIGTAGIGGLEEAAGKTGLTTVAKGLGLINKAANAGMITEGASNIYNQPTLGGKASGLVEAGAGLLGIKNPLAREPIAQSVENEIKPIIEKPRITAQQAVENLKNNGMMLPPEAFKPPTALDKLNQSLSEVPELNKQQANINREARAEKISQAQIAAGEGQDWAKNYLASLGGEHAKVTMEPPKLEQKDIDELFGMIKDSPAAIGFDKAHAITGLSKILQGQVPVPSELDDLQKVFGNDLVKSLRSKTGKFTNKSLIGNMANLPRAMMTIADISAPFRQGAGMILTPQYWKAIPEMIRDFGSEKFYKGSMQSIEQHPNFEFSQESGLKLTTLANLSSREEAYSSNLAEKIPGYGNYVVRPSERAYVGFLNKLRFDSFNSLINSAEQAGLNPRQNLVLSRKIADLVNNATGRGSLGKLFERHADLLNVGLFSPRLIASRINMLNPNTYIRLGEGFGPEANFIRKQYLKSLAGFATLGAGTLGLYKAAGAQVNLDPRSTDFAKAKIGDSRLDPWGGFQQYLVPLAKIASGTSVSSTTNQPSPLGSGFGQTSRAGILGRFGEEKLNPVWEFLITALRGTNIIGEKNNFTTPNIFENTATKLFLPMVIQDIYDLWKDNPDVSQFIKKSGTLVPPAVMGQGLQTYPSKY